MRTGHLQTVRASVAATRCCSGLGGFPQVNKFEQVSFVGHQMSVTGGRSQIRCGGSGSLPCDLPHEAFGVNPHTPWTNRRLWKH